MSNRSIELEATLRLALEALGLASAMAAEHNESEMEYAFEFTMNKLEKTFKEALMSFQDGAQPSVSVEHSATHGEPVAYEVQEGDSFTLVYAEAVHKYKMVSEEAIVQKLYTTPPTQCNCSQRQCNAVSMKHIKPLTDAQSERLYRNIEPSRQQDARSLAAFKRLLRVIEAAHGIKE